MGLGGQTLYRSPTHLKLRKILTFLATFFALINPEIVHKSSTSKNFSNFRPIFFELSTYFFDLSTHFFELSAHLSNFGPISFGTLGPFFRTFDLFFRTFDPFSKIVLKS